MVTNRAPHKEIADDPGAEVRIEMARLAAEGEEGVQASDLEVRRDEVSYSYRTLELLFEEEPGRELPMLQRGWEVGGSRRGWSSWPGWGWCQGPVSAWALCARRWSGSVPPIGQR